MTYLLLGAFFLFGAIIASFVGVVVARLHTGHSIARGRSRCDACNTSLGMLDLVPMLSYVASGGRARCCGARTHWVAPLTELVLGGLYAISYSLLGLTVPLALFLIALALLLALVLYDLAHMILPPVLLTPFVLLSIAIAWVDARDTQAFLLISFVALILALIILALHVFSRGRAMGMADAPLTFALALIAGPAALAGFAYSFWVGALIGIVLLFMRAPGSRMGVEVPFAPFLATGFLLAYFTLWNPFILISTLLGASPS